MVYFGQNLKFVRRKRKLNQYQLASMLDVKPNTISNYETSVSFPDFKSLEVLVKFFDVPVEDFLYTNLKAKEEALMEGGPYPIDEIAPVTQTEEEESEYAAQKQQQTSFWIILQQLQNIREQMEEIREILKNK